MILIKNIKCLAQVREQTNVPLRGEEMGILPCIENAFLITEGDIIREYGPMSMCPDLSQESDIEIIDATGKMVFPSFCDSHTHIVYAGSREVEFMDKIRGLSYQEIAARGGGILNSAALLHKTSEDDLFRQSMQRVEEMIAFGTGAIEIKSGYGLSPEDEIKMLRVAGRIAKESPVEIKRTFLGAHAYPEKYKNDHEGYVQEIINEMIPVIAAENLADYIDVFCEEGFFSVEDTDRILNAGMKYGLRPRVHANQMSCSGGVETGVKYNAITVDHLEYAGEEQISLLADSDTIANLLPGATFFLQMKYAAAREMISKKVALSLASNYNPGSCPCGDMKMIMSLACLCLRMTPEEAFNAATINGAFAMDLGETHGSITRGKIANLFITKEMPTYEYFPYSISTPLIDRIILKGKVYEQNN